MSKNKKISGNQLAVGGQAVLEGVLMRGLKDYNISVRDEKGKIHNKKVKNKEEKGFAKSIRKVPFIRGIFALWDALIIGYSALNYSAKIAMGEEEEDKAHPILDTLMIVFSFAFAIFLFKGLPYAVPRGIELLIGHQLKYFVLIEGIVKALIFVVYLLLISLMKDIFRVFQYHGAEHKTIHCYEKYGKGRKLTAKNAAKESRIHKRCGTTFLFLVVFVSIVIYAFLPRMFFWTALGLRLLLLPIIAGISFEILKIVPKLSNKNPLKWILFTIEYPGLMLQYISTKEPDLEQLEVAIHSLKKVI